MTFDTDSIPIRVDNRCTRCISHQIEDFEGPLIDTGRQIKGFGGSRISNVQMGTLIWKWQDNQGRIHKFKIAKSFYSPNGGVRLLSPQHWAQTQKDIRGTGSETTSKEVTLFWNKRHNQITIPLGILNNVATFHMAPGFEKYKAFCTMADINPISDWEDPLIAEPAQIISDDEDRNDEGDLQDVARQSSHPEGTEPEGATTTPTPEGDSNLWYQPLGTSFDTNGPSKSSTPKPAIVEEEEEDTQPTNKAAELLRYHHQFGHISFRKLQLMAKMGVLPRRLQNFPVTVYLACLYAKAIKKQWRY